MSDRTHHRSGIGTFLVRHAEHHRSSPRAETPGARSSSRICELLSLLRPEDLRRVTILEKRVQDVDLDPFLALERNDILFIDSTHVVKICSDVNFLLGEVLPRFRPGVYVHVHDIFYPFEYPEAWIAEGPRLGQAYVLRPSSHSIRASKSCCSTHISSTFTARYSSGRCRYASLTRAAASGCVYWVKTGLPAAPRPLRSVGAPQIGHDGEACSRPTYIAGPAFPWGPWIFCSAGAS